MRRLDEAAPVYDEEVYPAGDIQVIVKNPEAVYEGPGAPWFDVPSPPLDDERLSAEARLYYVYLLRAVQLKQNATNDLISQVMRINLRAGEKYRKELERIGYITRIKPEKIGILIERPR